MTRFVQWTIQIGLKHKQTFRLKISEEVFIVGTFVMAGFSNLEGRFPAAFFGVQDKLGRIKNGYRADLVILDENPLVNIKNTQKIFAVIKDGKFY